MNAIIDYKRTYTASDGDTYVYMGAPAYDVDKMHIINMATLRQDHSGRIDRVAYNNELNRNDIDLIMYANHIYNPFAIKEGDILYVPNSDDYYYTSEEPELIDGTKHSDSSSNTTKRTYAESVEYLAKLGLGVH